MATTTTVELIAPPSPPRSQDSINQTTTTTVDDLLSSLEALAAGDVPAGLLEDEDKRTRLMEAARKASLRLEAPWDTMQRMIFCAVPPNIAQAGVELGLWDAVAARAGAPASVAELAQELGAEEALLGRILRYAATQWMVEQVGPCLYAATNVTRHLAMEGMKSVIFHVTERNIGLYNVLPAWMAQNGYKEPQNNRNLPFHLAKNTDLHFFDWLKLRPRHQKAFNDYMTFQRIGQSSWLDVFPLQEYVVDVPPERTPFVDVGGGHGHQCRGVLGKFPQLGGRVVLEDVDAVALKSGEAIPGGVKTIRHDFMAEEQPVAGARVYYLRNILHDWPSDVCCKILRHIKAALAPDSVILIDDLVLQDTGAHWYAASFDLLMMANYGARERSVAEWDKILEAVGLERRRLVRYTRYGDAVQVVGPKSEN
ncbi:o-methyltransferase-like protein [Phyllosticta capitalensis]|uniref:O-methyltransferase-like protein n=1 Tax=Phyllosticta capitalensis TaxID=121624 RepID=A0ABR1YIB5_9PEZI